MAIEEEPSELDALMDELLDGDDATVKADESGPVGDWFSLAEQANQDMLNDAEQPGIARASMASPPVNGSAAAAVAVSEPDRSGRRRMMLLGLFAVTLIAIIAAAGYWFGRTSTTEVADGSEAAEPAAAGVSDTTSAEDATEADEATGTADDGAATSGEDGSASDGGDADGETTASETDSADEQVEEDFPTELRELTYTEMQRRNLPHAVIVEGQVFLRGRVPARQVADLAVARTATVVGDANVFDEFTVDPTVPLYTAAPVYVEDVVLFDFNSTTVRQDFFPLLELGVATMSLNENVIVTIVAFTDAVGSEAVNLEVATERAEAVRDYFVGRGIDSSRVSLDARGEVGASEADDEATAARNRRVEFIFDGLLN